jgi:hypothetical protein
MPIELFHQISVCIKVGSCFVDPRINESKDAIWTMTDLNDKSRNVGIKNNKFKIIKNGIHFVFTKGLS